MKRSIFLIIACLLSTSLFAAEMIEKEDDKFPIGCRDMGYKQDLMVLTLFPFTSGEEYHQSLYFMYNNSPKTVNLYHMRDNDSLYSMHFNSAINPKQWAVFSTGESKVKFTCTVADARSKSQYGNIVDCAQVLKVCEYNHVIYGLNNRGNFWMVKGNTKNGAVRDVVRYGIIPAT